MNLDPIGSRRENCLAGQVHRKSAADYRERLVHGAIHLRPRQARIVRVKENVKTGDRPRAEDHPISVDGLDVPSFTCGNNEIIGQIRAKQGQIGEGCGHRSDGGGVVVLIV